MHTTRQEQFAAQGGTIRTNDYHQGKMNAACAPQQCADQPPQREIPAQVARLFGLAELVSERLAGLETRLAPVLFSCPEHQNEGKNAVVSTELGDRLSQIALRLERIADALFALDNRLAV